LAARVVRTYTYEKRIARLLPEADQTAMENSIAESPVAHPVIPGTGGIRKARWSRPGMGKRGGIRVVYYFAAAPDLTLFLTAYAKNQKENLSDADKKELRKIAQEIIRSLKEPN
jgi:hypothetical protein